MAGSTLVTLSASRLVDVPGAQLEVLFAGDGEPRFVYHTPVKPGATISDDRVQRVCDVGKLRYASHGQSTRRGRIVTRRSARGPLYALPRR
jgi:hypothetical protein